MVNYIRGKILIDDNQAIAGTQYKVELLSGANSGYIFTGQADNNIPSSLLGNGFYDTLDNNKFSTGDSFRVSLIDYSYCFTEGIFSNGGNGNLETEEGLININCDIPNQAPVLDNIGNKAVNENELLEFTINAEDPNNDPLAFSANNLPSGANFNSGTRIFSWLPDFNDEGNYNVEFVVTDDELAEDRETIAITVLNNNRNPVLDAILNQIIDEDIPGSFNVSASDEDNDVLVFSVINENINEVNCETAGAQVNMNPALNFEGISSCEIQVSDNKGGTDSQAVNINVNAINDNPILDNITDITKGENNLVEITANANDADGDILAYSIDDDGLGFIQADNIFTWQTGFDDEGTYYVNVSADDGNSGTDSQQVKITILPNQAPEITSFAPDYNPKIPENGIQNFIISWADIDNPQNVIIRWFIDGILSGNENSYLFTGTGISKDYDVKVEVDDLEFNESREWSLITSDMPLTEKYNGDTTDFSSVPDLSDVFPFILEIAGIGKIEFLESVDLNDIVDLDRYSDIQSGLVGIDTSVFSSLKNKKARVTLYNLGYDKTPTIYYNSAFSLNPNSGVVCPSNICSNISYNPGNLEFEVSSFSTFLIGEILTCQQKGGFVTTEKEICRGSFIESRNSERCCSIKPVPNFESLDACEILDSRIKINIKNPDNNDNFKPGETIKGEVKIENKHDEKKDFDIEIFLYDITDDDELDDIKEGIKIKEGDDEKIEFEFELDDDLDDRNDYYVYARAGDEDSDSCNEDYVKLDVEREKDDVIIKEFTVEPETASCKDWIYINMDIKNIGSDEQDVYAEIISEELGIAFKSEEFELEEFDEDDEKKLNLDFKIPENTEGGEYSVKADVFFNGERASEEKTLFLEKCRAPEKTVKELSPVKFGEIKERKTFKIDMLSLELETGLIILIVILSGGIISVAILIGFLSKKR